MSRGNVCWPTCVFNLGWPRLSGFVNTLKAMHLSDYKAAAAGMPGLEVGNAGGSQGPSGSPRSWKQEKADGT